MKVKVRLTAVFEEAQEGGYLAYIEEPFGVNTQGETLDEEKNNLRNAIDVVFETQRMLMEKDHIK